MRGPTVPPTSSRPLHGSTTTHDVRLPSHIGTNSPADTQKLREEMVMAEMATRRELEAEVRREMMIEREIAFRRFQSFHSSLVADFRVPHLGFRDRSRVGQPEYAGFGGLPSGHRRDRLAMLHGGENVNAGDFATRWWPEREYSSCLKSEGFGNLTNVFEGRFGSISLPSRQQREGKAEGNLGSVSPLEGGMSGNSPFRRGGEANAKKSLGLIRDEANVEKIGVGSEPIVESVSEADKEPVEKMAKSISSQVGEKRKAKTSVVEWSCTLCQVTASCEQGLNDHFNGKKHKAKATLLDSSRLQGRDGNAELLAGKSPERQNERELLVDGRQKYRFWCKMCEIGTISEALMVKHRNGKKHMNLLRKNGGAVIIITTLPEDMQVVETTAADEGTVDSVEHVEDLSETGKGAC